MTAFPIPESVRKSCFSLFARLEFSVEEAYEFCHYMEDWTEVRGVLFRKHSDGRKIPEETILNPEIEDYFRFGTGAIFKLRYAIAFYSLDCNRKWNRDGDLQRKFYSGKYDYDRIRYQITEK